MRTVPPHRLLQNALILASLFSGPLWPLPTERPVSIGVNANWEQFLAQSANMNWSRIDIVWREINPSAGTWTWAVTDSQITQARGWGQQILGILHYPPQWVGGGPNGNIAPLTTTEWSEFVRRTAQRYAGQIAAYEVWNEPDDAGTGSAGIGWGRPVGEPPTYADFFSVAQAEVATYAPGTNVFGPALKTRATPSASSTRKNGIWAQISNGAYAQMSGSTLHNNAGSTEPSATMAYYLNSENIVFRNNNCIFCRAHEIWVTEYGFRANAVGANGQREKICNLTKIYTGRLEPQYLGHDWRNVTRAFIFLLKDPSTSAAIYTSTYTPMPVVTQYLQTLPSPATQNPAVSSDYPNCATGGLAATPGEVSGEAAWSGLMGMGYADPRMTSLAEFTETTSVLDEATGSFFAAFAGKDGESLSISVLPAQDSADIGEDSTAGLRWYQDGREFDIAGFRNGHPIGSALLKAVATELSRGTADFGCQRVWRTPSKSGIAALGLRTPSIPGRFKQIDSYSEMATYSSACPTEVATSAPVVDFTWVFRSHGGGVVTAGIYRFEDVAPGTVESSSSLHWLSSNGYRYWVALEPNGDGTVNRDLAIAVARSLDPTSPF